MTMLIKLEMSAEQEAQLREQIARQNEKDIQVLLAQMLAPTVKELLQEPPPETWDAESEALLDELSADLPISVPLLSDYAVSRASMYEDEAL